MASRITNKEVMMYKILSDELHMSHMDIGAALNRTRDTISKHLRKYNQNPEKYERYRKEAVKELIERGFFKDYGPDDIARLMEPQVEFKDDGNKLDLEFVGDNKIDTVVTKALEEDFMDEIAPRIEEVLLGKKDGAVPAETRESSYNEPESVSDSKSDVIEVPDTEPKEPEQDSSKNVDEDMIPVIIDEDKPKRSIDSEESKTEPESEEPQKHPLEDILQTIRKKAEEIRSASRKDVIEVPEPETKPEPPKEPEVKIDVPVVSQEPDSKRSIKVSEKRNLFEELGHFSRVKVNKKQESEVDDMPKKKEVEEDTYEDIFDESAVEDDDWTSQEKDIIDTLKKILNLFKVKKSVQDVIIQAYTMTDEYKDSKSFFNLLANIPSIKATKAKLITDMFFGALKKIQKEYEIKEQLEKQIPDIRYDNYGVPTRLSPRSDTIRVPDPVDEPYDEPGYFEPPEPEPRPFIGHRTRRPIMDRFRRPVGRVRGYDPYYDDYYGPFDRDYMHDPMYDRYSEGPMDIESEINRRVEERIREYMERQEEERRKREELERIRKEFDQKIEAMQKSFADALNSIADKLSMLSMPTQPTNLEDNNGRRDMDLMIEAMRMSSEQMRASMENMMTLITTILTSNNRNDREELFDKFLEKYEQNINNLQNQLVQLSQELRETKSQAERKMLENELKMLREQLNSMQKMYSLVNQNAPPEVQVKLAELDSKVQTVNKVLDNISSTAKIVATNVFQNRSTATNEIESGNAKPSEVQWDEQEIDKLDKLLSEEE